MLFLRTYNNNMLIMKMLSNAQVDKMFQGKTEINDILVHDKQES